MRKLLLIALSCLLSSQISAQEQIIAPDQERIISYHSEITINTDATVDVVETIKVYAGGVDIQRGIYRAYPTEYTDNDGYSVSVGFEVLEVLKNGQPEPYHMQEESNGEVVYIGDADVFLEPGEYTYTIKYRTDRQIGFFEEFDELYYNVNGTGWIFPLEQVSATIHLPQGAEVVQYAAYTGYEGDEGKDYEVFEGKGEIAFVATRPFGAYENLTVAVAWPKGVVAEPANVRKEIYQWIERYQVHLGVLGLLLVFIYWFVAWRKVGVDPPKGTIIPLFDPPNSFSPADCYFVHHMGYAKKALAADIVDMAVKGLVRIEYKKKTFILHRIEGVKQQNISPAQKKLLNKLFGGGIKLELKQENHVVIGKAVTSHEESLRSDLDNVHFKLNAGYIFWAALISIFFMLPFVPWGKEDTFFLLIWLSVWNIGVIAICAAAYNAFMNWKSRGASFGPVVGLSIFAIPFITADMVVALVFFENTLVMPIVLGHVIVNAVFIHLIKAPTVEGRKVMDHLEGFRLFLKKAEEHRLNQLQSRETALQLYEKYLPYAIALGVENDWGDHFETFFNMPADDGSTYRPHWYTNASMVHFSSSAFSHSVSSSLSSTISSSSTAPGSSSGSGGGGSSGGGGGGGGGGGW